ncbi:MAG: endonuclease/exonuclease/phosphatase family protein [FCB group bacterium]|nr:endonuclease/exonuclease/phosphatase family protein [FCB group bacterium]
MDQNESTATAPKRSITAWITDKVALLLVLVAGATLAAYLGRLHFLPELLTHFRGLYAVAALVLTAYLLMARSWRWAALGLAVAVVNLAHVAPYYVPPERTTAAPNLRMLTANVLSSNREHERLLSLIRAQKPDVVVLLEVDYVWFRAIASLRNDYPYVTHKLRHDNFGIAMISRLPFTSQELLDLGGSHVPALLAQVKVAGHPVNLMAVHAFPPGEAAMARTRDAQLHAAAKHARKSAEPIVVCGDFNAAPWSPIFADTLSRSGLKDARRGFGTQGTWPAQYAPCLIPLDHCLASPAIVVRRFQTLPGIGSDHLPILVELVVPVGAGS